MYTDFMGNNKKHILSKNTHIKARNIGNKYTYNSNVHNGDIERRLYRLVISVMLGE